LQARDKTEPEYFTAPHCFDERLRVGDWQTNLDRAAADSKAVVRR
jgi:hypothetical protein